MAQSKRGPGRPPGSKNKTTKKKTGTAAAGSGSKSGSRSGRGNIEKNVQDVQNMDESKAMVKDTIIACIIVALGIFLIIALQTDTAGVAGQAISNGLKGCCGFVAFFLPYCFIAYGVLLFLKKTIHTSLKSIIYFQHNRHNAPVDQRRSQQPYVVPHQAYACNQHPPTAVHGVFDPRIDTVRLQGVLKTPIFKMQQKRTIPVKVTAAMINTRRNPIPYSGSFWPSFTKSFLSFSSKQNTYPYDKHWKRNKKQ